LFKLAKKGQKSNFSPFSEKNASIEAHTATLRLLANLYDLGKIKVALSREFYQASFEIERFSRFAPHFDLVLIMRHYPSKNSIGFAPHFACGILSEKWGIPTT